MFLLTYLLTWRVLVCTWVTGSIIYTGFRDMLTTTCLEANTPAQSKFKQHRRILQFCSAE